MLLDFKTLSGFINNPDSAPTKGTYEYCVSAINKRIEEIKPLRFELVSKGISFKTEFPELFHEYKTLIELQNLINNPMKTLEEIKNEVAVKHGYADFDGFANNCICIDQFNNLINEVAEEYARQCCEEQIKACSKFFEEYGIMSHETILNTPNVVKL